MEVTIYIDVNHSGHLKYGTGKYAAVLEYITGKGKPATLFLLKGINRTTPNRPALFSCIDALGHLNKECKVKVLINSKYITEAINSNSYMEWIRTGKNAKGKPVSNLLLWQQLDELMEKHLFEFEYSESHTYTSWLEYELKNGKIEYVEDQN